MTVSRKLRVDFVVETRPGGRMTIDTQMADQLLTLAGMIMEDASVTAIISQGDAPLEARIAAVRDAGRAISYLVDAADIVRVRSLGPGHE